MRHRPSVSVAPRQGGGVDLAVAVGFWPAAATGISLSEWECPRLHNIHAARWPQHASELRHQLPISAKAPGVIP